MLTLRGIFCIMELFQESTGTEENPFLDPNATANLREFLIDPLRFVLSTGVDAKNFRNPCGPKTRIAGCIC